MRLRHRRRHGAEFAGEGTGKKLSRGSNFVPMTIFKEKIPF